MRVILLIILIQTTAAFATRVVCTDTITCFLNTVSQKGTLHGNKAFTELREQEDLIIHRTFGHTKVQNIGNSRWFYQYGFTGQDDEIGFTHEGYGTFTVSDVTVSNIRMKGKTILEPTRTISLIYNNRKAHVLKTTTSQLKFYYCHIGEVPSNTFKSQKTDPESICINKSYSIINFKIFSDGDLTIGEQKFSQGNLRFNHIFKGK